MLGNDAVSQTETLQRFTGDAQPVALRRARRWRSTTFCTSSRLRCASLGGGPAFELDAVREFCRTKNNSVEFAFYPLDLQPGWRPYAER